MNYWIITDTHFGHAKLVNEGHRPVGFEEKIFKSIMDNYEANDVLIHFGDISFDKDAEWHDRLKEIFCLRWLIKGNHDKHSSSWYISHGWHFVGDEITLTLYGYKILLSHIPKKDSGYDINIHGHFHDTDHRKHEPQIAAILNDKHVLLALEFNNYQVWNLRSVVEKFKSGKNK